VYFVKLQLYSGDYDAHIPTFVELKREHKLSIEAAVELSFLYMAYYSEASAWIHFQTYGGLHSRAIDYLPIETQRRNLYGGRIHLHLTELCELHQDKPWLDRLRACNSWSELLDEVGSVYGNGRWSSFTTSELLIHTAELDIEPDSFEVLSSSGPLNGMLALGLAPCEQTCKDVHQALLDEGITTSFSQLESLLCDWCGVCKGSFYSGRNWDRQQGRILKVEERTGKLLLPLWEVRSKATKLGCLGELNGWAGIDKQRLKHYAKTGVVLAPWEERNGSSVYDSPFPCG
jgi:hypothetical protein